MSIKPSKGLIAKKANQPILKPRDEPNNPSSECSGKEEFWKTWVDFVKDDPTTNQAPFDLTDDVIALLTKSTGNQFVALLGVFGAPNGQGHTYLASRLQLTTWLDSLVGHNVGELRSPNREDMAGYAGWLYRITAIVPENSAGTLLGYAINEGPDVGYGPVFEVVGLIEPSAELLLRQTTKGYFGIRSIIDHLPGTGNAVRHVVSLIGFDIQTEDPRDPSVYRALLLKGNDEMSIKEQTPEDQNLNDLLVKIDGNNVLDLRMFGSRCWIPRIEFVVSGDRERDNTFEDVADTLEETFSLINGNGFTPHANLENDTELHTANAIITATAFIAALRKESKDLVIATPALSISVTTVEFDLNPKTV